MNIDHALSVPGWMMESELMYLGWLAERSCRIVEVGSWMGRSTCALAENAIGRVIAVDTWCGSEEHEEMLANKAPNWLRVQFMENTSRYCNVAMARMESGAAAELFRGLEFRFDLIFLDASHDYDNVKADILAWMPLLMPFGIICGHDYDPPNWMGVKQAVDECVPKFRVVPGTTIWTTEGI